jgi:hypothetical protein
VSDGQVGGVAVARLSFSAVSITQCKLNIASTVNTNSIVYIQGRQVEEILKDNLREVVAQDLKGEEVGEIAIGEVDHFLVVYGEVIDGQVVIIKVHEIRHLR